MEELSNNIWRFRFDNSTASKSLILKHPFPFLAAPIVANNFANSQPLAPAPGTNTFKAANYSYTSLAIGTSAHLFTTCIWFRVTFFIGRAMAW